MTLFEMHVNFDICVCFTLTARSGRTSKHDLCMRAHSKNVEICLRFSSTQSHSNHCVQKRVNVRYSVWFADTSAMCDALDMLEQEQV